MLVRKLSKASIHPHKKYRLVPVTQTDDDSGDLSPDGHRKTLSPHQLGYRQNGRQRLVVWLRVRSGSGGAGCSEFNWTRTLTPCPVAAERELLNL